MKWRPHIRLVRKTILLFLFLCVGALAYLNQVGLPKFIKDPILAELHARGIDLSFSRMRWHWYRGIVLENVTVGPSTELLKQPRLSIRELEVQLTRTALLKLRLAVSGLIIHDGEVLIPLPLEGAPTKRWLIRDITAEIQFLPDDRWLIDHVAARTLGIQIQLSGNILHPQTVRDWPIFRRPTSGPSQHSARWRAWLSALEELRFSKPPLLKVLITGDARLPDSIAAEANFAVPAVQAPWGSLEELTAHARRPRNQIPQPPHPIEVTVQLGHGEVRSNSIHGLLLGAFLEFDRSTLRLTNTLWKLELARAETEWGQAKALVSSGSSLPSLPPIVPGPDQRLSEFDSQFTIRTGSLLSPWLTANDAFLTGDWRHTLRFEAPASARGELTLHRPRVGESAKAEKAVLAYSFSRTDHSGATNGSPEWGWWNRLKPFHLSWNLAVTDGVWKSFRVDQFHATGSWKPPVLSLDEFSANLYGKKSQGAALLNVDSRLFNGSTSLDFDLKELVPLLNSKTQRFFAKFRWVTAPAIQADVSGAFPVWTNPVVNWNEVKPTLRVTGHFTVGSSSYRDVPVNSAVSHVAYSNQVWILPDLHVIRPEGTADLEILSAQSPPWYRIGVMGAANPEVIAPLIGRTGRRVLELFEFHQAAGFTGAIWGPWNEDGQEGIHGVLEATNFLFRGEHFDRLHARVNYTNHFLSAASVDLRRGEQSLQAPGVGFQFDDYEIFLTNVHSTIDPSLSAKLISSNLVHKIAPYQFEAPPSMLANGSLRVKPSTIANLKIEVAGGPFSWWKFHLPEVRADLFWVSNSLTISNLDGSFYTGKVNGDARFVFATTNGADFTFALKIGAADFHLLMTDLAEKPNLLEGVLNGELTVGQAKTWDFKSWEGFGTAIVRDGLIWDMPVFGIFSSVLNAISPGLGNARAEQGTGYFVITNSVVRTDDLEFRGPTMRLKYRGTVDFEGNLNARVEAELLRDTWAKFFGLILSPMTKLFEFKVTGTLSQPHKEPLHLFPRVMLMPFQPKTWKDLFGIENKSPAGKETNPKPDK